MRSLRSARLGYWPPSAAPVLHIVQSTREGDPIIWGCSAECGFFVEREGEADPCCPKCGSRPCADCVADARKHRG